MMPARVEPVLLVFQFLLQQVHRRLVDGDLLRGQQRVVIRQPHAQQGVINGGLVLRERLLLRRARRLQCRDHLSAFVNGLDDLDARVPILVWRTGRAGESFNRFRVGVFVLARRRQMRQRDRARLHDHAMRRFQVVFRL